MLLIQGGLATLAITLGLGQLAVTYWRLWGLSLSGARPGWGYALAVGLIGVGAVILPATVTVLALLPLSGLLAIGLLLWGGSYLAPPAHPNRLFGPTHPAHGGCQAVQIPDGDQPPIPGLLLRPAGRSAPGGPAVCLVPGAGDTKTNFKWRLVQALLAEGLAVLTIDPPGHGDYRPRLLAYPDCLSAVPAALRFLREQPGISQVGLVGISLGGALALASLAAEPDRAGLGALVIIATPTELRYSKTLFYREVWGTLSRVPIITLFREMTVRQARQDWLTDGYRSRHSTAQLFDLLKPAESIARLAGRPILLVYSRRDRVAPPVMARAMHQAAPWATMIQSKKASHVTLILLPEINQQLSCWLKQTLA